MAEEEEKKRQQQEREERKARMQAEYEQSLEQKNKVDPSRIRVSDTGSIASLSLEGDGEQQQAVEGTDEFTLALGDDEMDADERDQLRRLRNQRLREEAARKRRLQEEHEERLRQQEYQQMLTLQQIAKEKQEEEDRRKRELEVRCTVR